jgi:uncharacterized membrane protein HdeD (DUF308 family)
MSSSLLERRRTGWDLVLGALLVIGGLVILGHAVWATAVSVLFLGWILLLVGVVGLVGAFFRIGKGGFWVSALSGGLLLVLGGVCLRNPEVAAVTLTLVAGALFLATGIVRLAASAQEPEYRWPLLIAGVVSTLLGLMVLFNLVSASYVLLGDPRIETSRRHAMMLVGRVRLPAGMGTRGWSRPDAGLSTPGHCRTDAGLRSAQVCTL